MFLSNFRTKITSPDNLCIYVLVEFVCSLKLIIMQACGAKYQIREELDEIDVDDVVVALVNLARRVSSCLLFH